MLKFFAKKINFEAIVVLGSERELARKFIFAVLSSESNLAAVKTAEAVFFQIFKQMLKVVFLRWRHAERGWRKKIFVFSYDIAKAGAAKKLLATIHPKIIVLAGVKSEDKEAVKLLEGLGVDDFVVLDANDKSAIVLSEKTRAKILKLGADVKIFNFEEKEEGIFFKLEQGGSFVPVFLKGASGEKYAQVAALAVLVGLIYNINLLTSAEKIAPMAHSSSG